MNKHLVVGVVAAVAVVAGGAWLFARAKVDAGGGTAISGATAASGPAVSVTTVRVQQRDVDVMLEATGTVQ